MAGIISYGAYAPRKRLQRSAVYEGNRWFAPNLKGLAAGERTIANWDEDAITMAVEAARDCLDGFDRSGVRQVCLASTSAPFADRQNATIVKEALNLSDSVGAMDIGASQKAGSTALLQSFYAAAGGGGQALVAGSDRRLARPGSEEELANGDGAACFLVGPDDGIARFVGAHSVSVDFADHFRTSDATFDYGWETRWVREEGHAKLAGAAVKGALEAHGWAAGDVTHFIAAIPAKGAARALAKQLGVQDAAVRDDLAAVMGYTGAAHPLVMLAHALEVAKPGDRLLVLGFGQGADVILLEATEAISSLAPRTGVSGWLARRAGEDNYLRYLALAGHLKLELGKRAEFEQKPVLTALYRNRKTVMGLVGGRCTVTGAIQFPRTEISVNPNAPMVGTQEDYPLADRMAKVVTFTADNLTYTPDPPGYYGMVEFESGGRLLTEFTDAEADAIDVGAPMRMMFRIKAVDERSRFVKYFWKAVPAAGRS